MLKEKKKKKICQWYRYRSNFCISHFIIVSLPTNIQPIFTWKWAMSVALILKLQLQKCFFSSSCLVLWHHISIEWCYSGCGSTQDCWVCCFWLQCWSRALKYIIEELWMCQSYSEPASLKPSQCQQHNNFSDSPRTPLPTPSKAFKSAY